MVSEIILNREMENLYCPITGKQILFPDDYSISPALLFIYIPEAEVFEFVSPGFIKDFPEEFEKDGTAKDPVHFFERLKNDPDWGYHKLLITQGICASVSLCFDMAYENDSTWSLFKK